MHFIGEWSLLTLQVSRALYGLALEYYPGKPDIWRAAAQLEMAHGNSEQVLCGAQVPALMVACYLAPPLIVRARSGVAIDADRGGGKRENGLVYDCD
jgi:hypothetical protein